MDRLDKYLETKEVVSARPRKKTGKKLKMVDHHSPPDGVDPRDFYVAKAFFISFTNLHGDTHTYQNADLLDWVDCVRKLFNIDKRSARQLVAIIVWLDECRKKGITDDFWVKNFKTIHKLRKKNADGEYYWDMIVDNVVKYLNQNPQVEVEIGQRVQKLVNLVSQHG